MNLEAEIKATIRDVPNFPKEGIIFKDITPVFKNAALCKKIVQKIISDLGDTKIDAIAGIESRGFLIGAALAMEMNLPFILIRKSGKLPYETVSYSYELEYGSAEIEMHVDAVDPGQNVLIHDDLLATGGSASAAAELVKKQGGNVAGFNFLIDLTFLGGQDQLTQYSENISTLVDY